MPSLTDPAVSRPPPATHRARATETGIGPLQNRIELGAHQLLADEPGALGGGGTGPGPYELLCAALAACTSMTVRLFAQRKGWSLEQVSVEVKHVKLTPAPATDGSPGTGVRDRFEVSVTLFGDLEAEQHSRLMDVADHCPVHRTLGAGAQVEVRDGRRPLSA
jgi:putative redox protein